MILNHRIFRIIKQMDAIQIAKRGFKSELLPCGGRAFINGFLIFKLLKLLVFR